ncbi:ABC transporter permease [Peribacillus butanolivorans]|uniref:ABC transporter permease n=1 Tax=Peribacillus butanolivorans TaxID=421767 RepID=A0AAX0RYF1_9BACI|nr:ABC transporter permease [Peribacillus butanolivorans]AXN40881.1 ABC transporter permease [Peribacillus butanolivorans]PEJ26711.1 ABC transporter permease [Peribacillus butanolivorans]QNU05262.1 ABC transporter permease [Peribacillus butanolivorans]
MSRTTVQPNSAIPVKVKRRKLSPERIVSVCTPLVMLLLWWMVSLAVGEKYLTSPGKIVTTMGVLFTDGYVGTNLTTHIVASLFRTIGGYVLAILLAIPIGLWMGMNKYVSAILSPVFAVIRPIPAIAFLPLFIMWFGIGEVARVMLIFMSAFLYIVLNTFSGVKTIPNGLIQAAKNLGANRIQLFSKVIFPATLPSIMTGLKAGLAVSWAIVVAAELMAAQEGLGYMIMDAATFFRMPVVYVGIVLIGLIGLILENIISIIEKKSCHWSGK